MSIGQSIAQARHDAGLTIEQVSASTRIRQTIIAAIEADDFSHSGGNFYARAHIRGIAQTVGLDPAPLLAEFDRTHSGEAPAASDVFESETKAKPERRGPNWTAAMGLALAVVIVYAVVQLVGGGGGSGSSTVLPTVAPVATPSSSRASSTPAQPQATQPSVPSSSPTNLVAKNDDVTVVLTSPRGKTWIRVTNASGRQLFEGNLDKNAQRTFTDPKKLQFIIGNPVAVDLNVNGQDLGSPGTDGKVAHLTFTPGDPNVG